MKLNKTIVLFVVLIAALVMSCKEHPVTYQHVAVDSLINIAYQARNYDSIISLANLHQQEGSLSSIEACYWRGYAYSRMRKMRMAETEWKNAIAQTIETDADLAYYAQSANRLVGLLYLKSDYGEAIRVALPAIRLLKVKDYTISHRHGRLISSSRMRTMISTVIPALSSDLSPLSMPISKQATIRKLWTGPFLSTICCRSVASCQACASRISTSSGPDSVCTVLPL